MFFLMRVLHIEFVLSHVLGTRESLRLTISVALLDLTQLQNISTTSTTKSPFKLKPYILIIKKIVLLNFLKFKFTLFNFRKEPIKINFVTANPV